MPWVRIGAVLFQALRQGLFRRLFPVQPERDSPSLGGFRVLVPLGALNGKGLEVGRRCLQYMVTYRVVNPIIAEIRREDTVFIWCILCVSDGWMLLPASGCIRRRFLSVPGCIRMKSTREGAPESDGDANGWGGEFGVKSKVYDRYPKTLLNKGTGFLSGYTYSLNPYAGCAFGCSYCYVRQMPVAMFRKEPWGTWVDVKKHAADLLCRELERAKKKGKVTIFMSSSTDPYQPIEYREKVTRSLLEVMVENPPDFLFVQTRSPLVCRDIDLFLRLKDRVRVSITIETDREDIRKHFTPAAPPINARFKTLKRLADAGVPTQATIAPVLPSSETFPEKLKQVVNRVCVDDYFMGDGSGGRRTKNLGIDAVYKALGLEEWYDPSAYRLVYDRLKQVFSDEQIHLSQSGFLP